VPDLEHLLRADEHIHAVTREHGIVLVRPFAVAAAAIATFGAAAYVIAGIQSLGAGRALFAVLLGLLASRWLVGMVRAVSRWHTRRLVVTDRRLIMVGGGFSRRIAVLPLSAIDAVEARTDGMGRRFHYGSLFVTSSGRRMPLFGLRRLPDPDLLFGLIMGLDGHIPMRVTPRERTSRPARVPASAR
jgi:membrane protein YdbS with pleckstrin-like domain